MREIILNEIKRLAAENGGVPPGRGSFARVTGITPAKWTGVYWVSWGDALKEAGFQPNTLQGKLDTTSILTGVGSLCRKLGRLPTHAEIKFERRGNRNLPAHSTVTNHFPTNAALAAALRRMAETDSEWSDLLEIVPEPVLKSAHQFGRHQPHLKASFICSSPDSITRSARVTTSNGDSARSGLRFPRP